MEGFPPKKNYYPLLPPTDFPFQLHRYQLYQLRKRYMPPNEFAIISHLNRRLPCWPLHQNEELFSYASEGMNNFFLYQDMPRLYPRCSSITSPAFQVWGKSTVTQSESFQSILEKRSSFSALYFHESVIEISEAHIQHIHPQKNNNQPANLFIPSLQINIKRKRLSGTAHDKKCQTGFRTVCSLPIH